MAERIKLFVNGQEVEIDAGKNLIDALSAAGIEIPHFCYHPALGADGNCRMCLVGIEDGRPPLVPACKTPAVEGMKVQLDTDKIRKIQKDMMEFELINHPIDCPVCDQAGECALQDYYMAYDGQSSRMDVAQVKKSKKMDYGSGVVHDQERCILCARCVRFCRQITGTGELGIVNRSDEARVVIFPGRPLANRYALNVVDLCPVGAMTSADFRFRQRVWFLKRDKSICHGCSKGCNIYIDHSRETAEDDIIYRFRPRHNELVNGWFICDEGRMSYKHENIDRLGSPLKRGAEIDHDQAVELARRIIGRANKVLVLLSPNLSLEQMTSARIFAERAGAALSGYSDGYIKPGDGDDFLIRDDKSANRKSLELLGIDCGEESFYDELARADLLISVGHDLRGMDEKRLKKALKDTQVIALSSHRSRLAMAAEVAFAIASFSEYGGMVINCDGVLQRFDRAVCKNVPKPESHTVLAYLGSAPDSREEIHAEIADGSSVLAKIDLSAIPGQGLPIF